MGVISGRYGISAAHSGQSNYIGHKIRLREGELENMTVEKERGGVLLN